MSCDLSAGRALPCKDVVGGITAVYFTNYGDIGTVSISATTDEVEDMSGGAGAAFTAFKYDLKGDSSFEQTANVSRATGTTFYEQTLTLTLTKLTKEDNVQLKKLAYGRPQIVVVDYNGNAFLMGAEYGADASAGTISTGTAMGDLSGYTMTLVAQEKLPANFMSGATVADPYAGMTSPTVTITAGTPF